MKFPIALSALGLVAAAFAWPRAGAAATLSAAQKSAICTTRATCSFGKIHDAGKSPAGAAMAVAEVHLGFKDKPDDAPNDGCRADDKFDGGVEYWLMDGAQPPKRILKFCNDGYGASGVGEDDVLFNNNILIHKRVGGSAWRWESTTKYTLAPWRAIAERDCSFNDLSSDNGTVTDIDFLTMTARTVAKDSAAKWGEGVGCPDWPEDAAAHFTPQPAPNLLGGYNILTPALGKATPPPKIPPGTAIGDCVPAITTSGANGFIVFGSPAPPGKAAEIRVIAEPFQSLLIQVFDPAAASQPATLTGSWINLPHVEVWIFTALEPTTSRPAAKAVAQFGIDLNGKVYAGAGKKEALPKVERWQARDPAARPVTVMRLTWPSDTEFANGVAVVYSQAEAGKQARLVATTGIVKNRPLYVPGIVGLPNFDITPTPGNCRVHNGRLALGS
jgi:hypothetical protein